MMTMMRLLAVALAAAAVVGCSSSSNREPSTPATASTGPGATDRAAATTAAPGPSGSTIATPSPRPSRPSPNPSHPRAGAAAHPAGIGGVPVGSTLGEFAEALDRSPVPMSAAERSVFDEHRCAIRRLARLPGVGFMVIGDDPAGRVGRIHRAGLGCPHRHGNSARQQPGRGPKYRVRARPRGAIRSLSRRWRRLLIRSGPGSDLYLAFIGDDRDRVVEVRIGYTLEVLNPEGCV